MGDKNPNKLKKKKKTIANVVEEPKTVVETVSTKKTKK